MNLVVGCWRVIVEEGLDVSAHGFLPLSYLTIGNLRCDISEDSIMASPASKYSTKELSDKTWPDFEKLFEKPGGLLGHGVAQCWCMYNHRPGPIPESKSLGPKARRARNRREKREL